jgi:hypothetical protein
MKKIIISLCLVPVALQLFLIANSVYAHTHKNHQLDRMYAVGACIAQRAFERKQTPTEVCLKKWQFSCWNGKSVKDLEHLLKTPQAKYAITVAKNVKSLSREFIGYANHYHATWMKKKPYWAKGQKPVKVIGQHAFYKL